MAASELTAFLHRLARGMAAQTLGELSDSELVERALAGPAEAAFHAIVRRHGPMVYRVCWRVLRHPQDTEDAFQATFLVLARSLRTLRRQASLASWLHGVAHRVALKARAQAAARLRREHRVRRPQTLPPEDYAWAEVRSVLDAELRRLPDRWRVPLILCYLEGRTQDEAAEQLGWSKCTFKRRLHEARAALGARLARRGLAAPAALAALLLSDCITAAMPADTLIARAAEAPFAALCSARALTLAQGVNRTMLLTKTTLAAVAIVLLGTITFAGSGLYHGVAGAQSGRVPAVGPQAAPTHQEPRAGDAERALQLDARGRILFGEFPRDTPITDQGGVGVIRLGEKKAALLFARPDLRDGFPTAYRLSPDGKQVAYTLQTTGVERNRILVRSLDPPGQPEDMGVDGQHVAWSPDGSQLLVSGGQAGNVVVDLKTKRQTSLDLPERHRAVEFSPDATALLLEFENDHGKTQLAWMNRQDRKIQPLAGTEGCWEGRISPSGKQILFVLPGAKKTSNLWVLDRHDGNPRKVNPEINCSVRCASWSPSGQRVAYTLTRFDPDSTTPPFEQDTESFVMVSDLAGEHQQVLVSRLTAGLSAVDLTLWDWR
jgi:RNA polymerase sigma factor (sigma-70 family)